jgi:tetratricopeptide (TPR) repeat protein
MALTQIPNYYNRERIKQELKEIESSENHNETQDFINEGRRFFKLGEYDVALYYYQLAQEEEPDNEMIAYNIGYLYYLQQEYEEALSYFQLAADLNPDFDEAKQSLANLVEKINILRKYVFPIYQ